jgi:hypothetical protein
MITANRLAGRRGRTLALTALMSLALALPVSACSSGPAASAVATAGPAAPQTAAPQTAAQQACQQVSDVLADGPDPDADPVGHAEAQILPLRQIRTPDAAIGLAIAGLADAYSGYLAVNGAGKAATATLTTAINKINSLCPDAGAAP